jgi:hypothetical protein
MNQTLRGNPIHFVALREKDSSHDNGFHLNPPIRAGLYKFKKQTFSF